MRLGLGLGLTRSSGVAAFNPLTLNPTAWYDPSDTSTVFTDLAGTTVAGNGDLVRRVNDKSGNGNHLLVGGDANRPTLVQAGALWYLDFTTDDYLDDSFGASIPQPTFVSIALKLDTIAATQTVFDNNNAGSADRQNIHFDSGTGQWNLFAGSATAIGAGSTSAAVISGNFNGASSVGYVNGVASAAVNPGANAAQGIRIGNSNGLAAPVDGRYYGIIFLPRTPTATERANIHTYLGAKAGLTL